MKSAFAMKLLLICFTGLYLLTKKYFSYFYLFSRGKNPFNLCFIFELEFISNAHKFFGLCNQQQK